MEKFGSEILPFHLSIQAQFRYNDLVFNSSCLASSTNHSDFRKFLSKLYALVRAVNVTTEWELSGKLPIPRVLLHNGNGSLKFSFYRKPPHAANYLFFYYHYCYNHYMT